MERGFRCCPRSSLLLANPTPALMNRPTPPERIPCGAPSESRFPERPCCAHGPMHSSGRSWRCGEVRRLRERERYWRDPIGQARRKEEARRSERIGRLEGELNALLLGTFTFYPPTVS